MEQTFDWKIIVDRSECLNAHEEHENYLGLDREIESDHVHNFAIRQNSYV